MSRLLSAVSIDQYLVGRKGAKAEQYIAVNPPRCNFSIGPPAIDYSGSIDSNLGKP